MEDPEAQCAELLNKRIEIGSQVKSLCPKFLQEKNERVAS